MAQLKPSELPKMKLTSERSNSKDRFKRLFWKDKKSSAGQWHTECDEECNVRIVPNRG